MHRYRRLIESIEAEGAAALVEIVTPWIASFLAMTDKDSFIPEGRPRPLRN